MRKIFVSFIALLVVASLSACASTSIVERTRKDINPLVGGTSSKVVMVSSSDKEDPYIMRFVLEFEKPMKADAFWTFKETKELIHDGIEIHKIDKSGYVQLFTLDMREVKRLTGSFATPIELNLGYNNPISGYPSFHRIAIHKNETLPEEERNKCFEATCLEIVGLEWNTEKQKFEEKFVDPPRPLKE